MLGSKVIQSNVNRRSIARLSDNKMLRAKRLEQGNEDDDQLGKISKEFGMLVSKLSRKNKSKQTLDIFQITSESTARKN